MFYKIDFLKPLRVFRITQLTLLLDFRCFNWTENATKTCFKRELVTVHMFWLT